WLATDPARAAWFGPARPATAAFWASGLLVGLGSLTHAVSLWVTHRARRLSPFDWGVRRFYLQARRLSVFLVMAAYLWLLFGVGWVGGVRGLIGRSMPSAVEEVAVLAPFLLSQLVVWWGFLRAERALELPGADRAGLTVLVLEARREWGLVLPVLLVLLVVQDLFAWLRPEWADDVLAQALLMGLMGVFVIVLAPIL